MVATLELIARYQRAHGCVLGAHGCVVGRSWLGPWWLWSCPVVRLAHMVASLSRIVAHGCVLGGHRRILAAHGCVLCAHGCVLAADGRVLRARGRVLSGRGLSAHGRLFLRQPQYVVRREASAHSKSGVGFALPLSAAHLSLKGLQDADEYIVLWNLDEMLSNSASTVSSEQIAEVYSVLRKL